MKLLFCTAVLSALVATAATAQADPLHPYLDTSNKHLLVLGYTWQEANVELSARRNPLPEASIDLDDLGTDDTYNSWFVEYRYRITDNWAMVASAYTFETDGSRTASRDFNFDGVEFEAGAALDTDLEVDTYIFDLMYTAYRGERGEVLVGGGFHMFDLSAEIAGTLSVGDFEVERSEASDEVLAPLPNFRAQGFYAFSPRVAMLATVGWLSANYDDYDGSFLYMHARLHYRFDNGFGVSAGYQFTDIDLERDKSNGKNKYELEFDGPTLLLSYSF